MARRSKKQKNVMHILGEVPHKKMMALRQEYFSENEVGYPEKDIRRIHTEGLATAVALNHYFTPKKFLSKQQYFIDCTTLKVARYKFSSAHYPNMDGENNWTLFIQSSSSGPFIKENEKKEKVPILPFMITNQLLYAETKKGVFKISFAGREVEILRADTLDRISDKNRYTVAMYPLLYKGDSPVYLKNVTREALLAAIADWFYGTTN